MYKVYKLTFENGETYIGSTKNLAQRLREHRTSCKIDKIKDRKLYKCMREHEFTHEVIFEENCTKTVARQLEQRFIDMHQPTLNCLRAFQSREQLKQQKKEYREKHKEQILLQKKETITCECGSIVTKRHIAKHKRTKKHLEIIATKLKSI